MMWDGRRGLECVAGRETFVPWWNGGDYSMVWCKNVSVG